MKNKEKVIQAIQAQGILPLFYHDDLTVSIEVVRSLYASGVRAIEYTNRGKNALVNFKSLKEFASAEMSDLYLGIGTVKTRQDAISFLDVGADYIVCPILNEEVGSLCYEKGVLWIPGCFSPTEIFRAQQHHADIIKLFPANVLTRSFLTSIRSIFPDQLFIPTGGVEMEADQINKWFKAGVCAVGLGSNLIKGSLLEKRDYAQLKQLSIEALRLIKENRV